MYFSAFQSLKKGEQGKNKAWKTKTKEKGSCQMVFSWMGRNSEELNYIYYSFENGSDGYFATVRICVN